jgi:hypothetical protein
LKQPDHLLRFTVLPAFVATLAFSGLIFATPVHAQEASAGEKAAIAAQAQSDAAIVRAAINAERVSIINDYLGLTEAESTAFWPVYKKYRTEVSAVNDEKGKLITNFLQNYNTLSDDDARKLTESYVSANRKKVDIQKGYIGKFAKILPGKKVARLYQLENKVDAALAYEVADSMPLMPVK